jgi:hypothetical protein
MGSWGVGSDQHKRNLVAVFAMLAITSNKVFIYGGAAGWPGAVVGYAQQARQWLTRAIQAAVDDALLSQADALALATRLMSANRYACFRLAERKYVVVMAAQSAAAA